MNSTQKFNVAFGVIFGLLAIATGIAVILGATHQWLMFTISVIMVALCVAEYKQESNKRK